jgi:hypothetical protein
MCAQWSKNLDPNILIREVAACAKLDGENVSFTGWQFHDLESILAERLEFHPEIPDADRAQVFWKALLLAAKTNQLTVEGLEKTATIAESEYLQQPISQYLLFSTLSLDRLSQLKGIDFDGCKVMYFGLPDRTPQMDRSGVAEQIDWMFRDRKLPTNYSAVTVEVQGRTPRAAAERALDAASLSRALVNLWENRHVRTMHFDGRPEPVNALLPGPISTIHRPNGTLAWEEFWYEPSYVTAGKPHKIRRPERFPRHRKSLLLRLAKHPYGSALKDALLRYNSALDKTDYDSSIVELWSVLETLVGIDNARYDDLVRRVSFLYSDRDWARTVLSHIRHYRNRSVHSGRSSTHRNDAVHIARGFVEDLLMFHWYNEIDARNLAEACEFLHLERDTAKLERRMHLLAQAVRFCKARERNGSK